MSFATRLFAGSGYILYNRHIAAQTSVEAAILLGFLCDRVEVYGDEFYCQHERIMEMTALTEYSVKAAIQQLAGCGFITVAKRGMPAKNHYTVHGEKILEYMCGPWYKPEDIFASDQEDVQSGDFAPTSQVTPPVDAKTHPQNNPRYILSKREEKERSKRVYGILQNVRLTDSEYSKLQEMFPRDFADRIDDLSTWLKDKGKVKKDHYATILNWSRMDKKRAAAAVPARREAPIDYD